MTKQEKYHKFVVNKLLDVVKIDYHEPLISFPWVMEDIENYYNDSHTEFPFYKHIIMEISPYNYEEVARYPTDMEFFSNYVQSKFGVRESEITYIWREMKSYLYDEAERLNE